MIEIIEKMKEVMLCSRENEYFPEPRLNASNIVLVPRFRILRTSINNNIAMTNHIDHRVGVTKIIMKPDSRHRIAEMNKNI